MNNNFDFNLFNYQDSGIINEMFMNNNLNNIPNIVLPSEGYIRGNLYDNLYDQYKNYRPARLIPNSEEAELLLKINQDSFASHDIRLYLDLNPDDINMINLFNKYQENLNNEIKEYESKYGPILSSTKSDKNMFSWEVFNFPWVKEGM